MKNDNAVLEVSEIDSEDSFDFDELESKLESELASQLSDLEMLEEDRKKIGNPESLDKVIYDTVFEHINNQIAGFASEEFIKKNRGLEFDPRNSKHIQTTENFADGNIATHNDKIDYQKRYNDWDDNFQKDENGNIKMKYHNRSKTFKKVLKKGARALFDENRPRGSASRHKDHTIPVAEFIRDPQTNAHLEKKEQVDFANSDVNLKDLDAAANMSKGDSTQSEFLDSERDGKKPAERFNIDEKQMREDDKIAREDFKKVKEEGEHKSIETGKQSQKEEISRMGKETLKAIGIQLATTLLSDLLKEIIRNLISWFKSANKKIETFLDSMKAAISSFATKLKNEFAKHLKNAGSIGIKVIVGAIFEPIGRIIKKFGAMISQGFKSIKEAIDYLKNPENKNKSFAIKIAQVGKIVVAGLSGAGAILGGEVIEKGLIAIPIIGPALAVEIPFLGSLANLIGLFIGAMVAGIIGAITLNLIDGFIANRLKAETTKQKIDKGNDVLDTLNKLTVAGEENLINTKDRSAESIKDRHEEVSHIIKESFKNISANDNIKNKIITSENEEKIKNIFNRK